MEIHVYNNITHQKYTGRKKGNLDKQDMHAYALSLPHFTPLFLRILYIVNYTYSTTIWVVILTIKYGYLSYIIFAHIKYDIRNVLIRCGPVLYDL